MLNFNLRMAISLLSAQCIALSIAAQLGVESDPNNHDAILNSSRPIAFLLAIYTLTCHIFGMGVLIYRIVTARWVGMSSDELLWLVPPIAIPVGVVIANLFGPDFSVAARF